MGSYTGTLPEVGAGSVVTDTDIIGEILGALHALVDAGDPYTPAWHATSDPSIGAGTMEGSYRRTGSWGQAAMRIVAAADTTFGSGSYEFTLPPDWNLGGVAQNHNYGTAVVLDTSASFYYVCSIGAVATDANRFRVRPHGQNNLSATSLVTLANGDQIIAFINTQLA